jgi:hypothetical protein
MDFAASGVLCRQGAPQFQIQAHMAPWAGSGLKMGVTSGLDNLHK